MPAVPCRAGHRAVPAVPCRAGRDLDFFSKSNDDFGLRRFFRKNFEPGDFEWAAAVLRGLQRRTEGCQGSRGRRSSTERRRDSENFVPWRGRAGRGRLFRKKPCRPCRAGRAVPATVPCRPCRAVPAVT